AAGVLAHRVEEGVQAARLLVAAEEPEACGPVEALTKRVLQVLPQLGGAGGLLAHALFLRFGRRLAPGDEAFDRRLHGREARSGDFRKAAEFLGELLVPLVDELLRRDEQAAGQLRLAPFA